MRRTCRACGAAEKTVEGESNMYKHVDYCLACVRREAAAMRREERRRWLR
jgi:hypothetical protein